VTSASPDNLATLAAVSVTVSGLYFAAFDLSPTAVLGTGVCGTASWTSSTSVHCLSSGASLPPAFAPVTVNSIVGTGANVFTFDGLLCVMLAPFASPVDGFKNRWQLLRR